MNNDKQNRNVKSLHLSPRNSYFKNNSLASFKTHPKCMNAFTFYSKSPVVNHIPNLQKKLKINEFTRKERSTNQNIRKQNLQFKNKNCQEYYSNNLAHRKLENCFLQLLYNVKSIKNSAFMNQTQSKFNQKLCSKQNIKILTKNQHNYKKNTLTNNQFLYGKDSFTIPLKQVRRKHRKQKNNDQLNCRVINIFQSIEDNIQSIHQNQTMTVVKNVQVGDSLQNKCRDGRMANYKQKQSIKTVSRKGKRREGKEQYNKTKIYLSELQNIKTSKSNCLLLGQQIQLSQRPKDQIQKIMTKFVRKTNTYNQQQIELKPWSTKQIHLID